MVRIAGAREGNSVLVPAVLFVEVDDPTAVSVDEGLRRRTLNGEANRIVYSNIPSRSRES